MKLKTGIFLAFLSVSLAFTPGRTPIEYRHRSVQNALQKAGAVSDMVQDELPVPDSIAGTGPRCGKYFLLHGSTQYRYLYIGRVTSCRAGGCALPSAGAQETDSEYFDYFILFDSSKAVRTVKIFNYQASHGQEITSRGWLKQFAGYNGDEALQVNKNIDAISGATISVYAITHDVEMKTQQLKQLTE